AHELFGPGFWPGDWVWATTTAGALLGLFPVVGAMIVALIRKGTGNRYDGVMMGVLAVLGVLTVLVLPAVFANGISEIYRSVAAGQPTELTAQGLVTMSEDYALVGQQGQYLGGGANAYEILFYPAGDSLRYGYYLGVLVGLPLLILLFVMLQARIALRRGPKWPGRFFWISFVLCFFATVTVAANTAAHLWIGFLLVSVLGLIPVALLGPPSWHRISNSGADRQRRRERPPEPDREPAPAERRHGPYPATAVAAPPAPAAGAAAAAAPAAANTSNGSRYRRVRQLGSGGFGTVWEAVDTQLDRTVALKIAHAPDADTEQRMQREARALAALNHPNCVQVYDLAEEPDGLALVMEYLQGEPLARTVDTTGPLTDVPAGRLWATLADALSTAHENDVLHRDVKP